LLTQKGRFDAEASVGLSSCNLNAAYSPVKYFAIFGNGQSFIANASNNYQKSAEAAIGLYKQVKKVYFGINAGYGLGMYDMKFNTTYMESHTGQYDYVDVIKGGFNKCTGQAYISFLDDPENSRVQIGLSFKFNYYWDNYLHTSSSTGRHSLSYLDAYENIRTNNVSAELCFFSKFYIGRNFYTNFQLGYRPGNEDFNYVNDIRERRIILRTCIGLNISTLRKSKKA
jgi:hypothetical protein